MYNQYLAAAEPINEPPLHSNPHGPQKDMPNQSAFSQNHDTSQAAGKPEAASVFSGITKTLSGRLQHIKLDMDTIIVLILVWFLLSDGDSVDWDLIVLVGILLVLGI